MAGRRLFRFSYHVPGRVLLPHQLRDGDAFVELAAALYPKGFEYGGLLLNYPTGVTALTKVDTSFLAPADLLVLTTRPPLDDKRAEVRRWVGRSYTTLEEDVFATLRRYFKVCARSRVTLSEMIAAQLSPEFIDRASIEFRVYAGATYHYFIMDDGLRRQTPPATNLTATYLLYAPEAWDGGPGLLASFGMGGTEGLIWAYLVRTRFPDMLGSPRFVMAELAVEELPRRPSDLSFADKWQVNILVDYPLPAPQSALA